jgi:signal transduction histidine kinase
MGPRAALLRLLRVPLAWKIAGANALLTLALAAALFALPSALAKPGGFGLLGAAVLLAVILNVGLISIALQPIHDLERTAERVWSGATDVRVKRSLVADRDLLRVAHTVDTLLERLEGERVRLKQLSTKLIEARSSERAALARELTETVAQSATALALECAALKAANGNGQRAERLDTIGRTANQLVEEIRRIARDVHPRHIEELGLETALRSLARDTSLGSAQQVNFTTSGIAGTAEALPPAVADALYDVAREALKNTRCHSAARLAEVSLDIERHCARLSIVDNGCGFDPAVLDPSVGLGLKLIGERVTLLGGTLEILTRPGAGTRIVARVPLVQRAAFRPEFSGSNN